MQSHSPALALPVYLFYQAKNRWLDFARQLRASWWLIFYLPNIAFVSWAGSASFGGHSYLTWGWDLVVVAALGLIFFIWGVKSGWYTPAVQDAQIDHSGTSVSAAESLTTPASSAVSS